MIPIDKVKKIIDRFISLEKELSTGKVETKFLAKKSTNKGVLDKMAANQRNMNKNFNDLAKAVNNLANQSGELAKSFKKSSYIKYP